MTSNHRKSAVVLALALLGVLFVALVLVGNQLLRGARIDLTEDHLYTLSPGTRAILAGIDEPVRLTLFFSEHATRDLPQLRSYQQRVREMLEEMAQRARGKLQLEVVDPLPFSEDEDRAAGAGLSAAPIGSGGAKVFFGLVGTNSTDGQAVIPFFQPDKEAFLEYDIAKLVHDLTMPRKPVVAVLSRLPLAGGVDPRSRAAQPPWAVLQELRQLFDVRVLDAQHTQAIGADVQVLLLVQPRQLPDDALYAVDQFVMRGGRLAVFVDPDAETDVAPDAADGGIASLAPRSSDLPRLFKAWGVSYDPDAVVLDRARALSIAMSADAAPVRHPAVLGYTAEDLNRDDVITANLQSINVSSAGCFALAPDSTAQLVPLLQSTADAMRVPAARVRLQPDPGALLVGYRPDNVHYVIAGWLEGRFRSAFPERKGAGHLDAARAPGQILLVADTDLLSDRLWVQMTPFFGQTLLNAFANNGDFAVNAVDYLAGSSELISIRGRASARRPFTRVEALRRSADERFRAKQAELERELADTERRLAGLQQEKAGDNAQILSPAQKQELEAFLKRKLAIRRELRDVQRQLDAEIEALGARLKFLDIALMPILLTLVAMAYAWRRARRRRAAGGEPW
ncbi:MAG: Gldg family protein [Mizugakiibacter sp.]|uniref:GldG family protein n=1 Tax=Mizugakiibacter sp. TaxID=1972610 RepID=UPI00320CBA5F